MLKEDNCVTAGMLDIDRGEALASLNQDTGAPTEKGWYGWFGRCILARLSSVLPGLPVLVCKSEGALSIGSPGHCFLVPGQ